ncbi:hypothetical protein VOLCADRAFT_94032 [Volvox carteri f. nagariensis]|uniref:Cilium assembly protein DZIP1 N-terminal domain-containing protein n=1 Tax=Volvox carteri f. nagariensis TaxID=3068 RepID=D8U3R1_VOLCA|nr:uncharacterized protein VOLCADRAFT_94032 [Volvox carteri f. nagariensis]EFJ45573.1 hypothetical protein VOLCADRAFT_94032 [Volvox carteri f. nagariensis]|eukprot:XP_002953263.1 hypothetical protein VOLCADRAFT_94032 [Volvox carteri f. nagariensis]
MATRQPLALSLAGFQFTYRNNYFDWRLLHGIDIDTVIRLTDVQAVEDCLDTLQRGSFAAERDRLSPANCVQLFRLLQLAVEYCGHLRAAHALLLECYNTATAAAESWKAAARSYLEVGSVFVSESVTLGSLSRGPLDATDAAKAVLEAADREYNLALDALEASGKRGEWRRGNIRRAEDSRARHFRFRKQRTEISWSTLNAADVDRLVSSLDVGLLEGLLPNLTYGSITNEDDEQLTPHHFGQLIPLGQAALDYVLWQANATGALMEQAMAGLQAACADIPTLTSATQELHAEITSLLLGGQPQTQNQNQILNQPGLGLVAGIMTPSGGGGGGAGLPDVGGSAAAGGGGGDVGGLGSAVPWASASADLSQQYGQIPVLLLHGPPFQTQYGGRPGLIFQGLTRTSSPAPLRPVSGGPGGAPQELVAAASLISGGGAGGAGGGSGGTAGGGFPVLELHSRATELNHKVDVIEQDLRMERSKTEEMRRILTDIRDRLNQRPGGGGGGGGSTGTMTQQGPGGGGGGDGGLSPAESLTFPSATAYISPLDITAAQGLATYSAFVNTPSAAAAAGGGGGGSRYGSAAGVSISGLPQSDMGPTKVRVFVDEDAIREQERQRAVQVLARQAEKLKQQMLREHQERRLVASGGIPSTSPPALGGVANRASSVQHLIGGKEGPRHSRQSSREGIGIGSGIGMGGGGGGGGGGGSSRRPGTPQYTQPPDYSSDPEQQLQPSRQQVMYGSYEPQVVMVASSSRHGSSGGAGSGGGGAAPGGGSRPPKPFSRLSGMHGSLGDLPMASAAVAGVYGMAGGSGGGSRSGTASGGPGQEGRSGGGGSGAFIAE